MALTEEQKERMRINRERALERKRRRSAAAAAAGQEKADTISAGADGGGRTAAGWGVGPNDGKTEGAVEVVESSNEARAGGAAVQGRAKGGEGGEMDDAGTVLLEDFEVGASRYVTKQEAMQKYCLPEGTLAVCSYVERANPRNKGWTPMKLYERSEVRRRARERHGGMEGLIEERERRQRKRLAKDLEETKDIFKRSKN